jgi:hypothetical protein
MIKDFLNDIIRRKFTNLTRLNIRLSASNYLLKNSEYYKNFLNINDAGLKVYSQNNEDGIIHYLLTMLSIKNPKFIEIGTESRYQETNTRFLYESTDSEGLIIDNFLDIKYLEKELEKWKGRIKLAKECVSSENINLILSNNNFHKDLDIFSLDIDGVDYWIIDSLPPKISKIFIAEYNPFFGHNLEITVPNIKNFNRTNYHYSNLCFGMSLKALINIMKKKGYIFLGVNNLKNNAFFVIESLAANFNKVIDSLDLYNLKAYTDCKFMESLDKNNKLQYLSKNQEFDLLKETEVIDLSLPERPIKKIKDLL